MDETWHRWPPGCEPTTSSCQQCFVQPPGGCWTPRSEMGRLLAPINATQKFPYLSIPQRQFHTLHVEALEMSFLLAIKDYGREGLLTALRVGD
jgi:hypothetical protein